jgi:hypothetical protein
MGTDPRIGQRCTVDCVGGRSSWEQWACSILLMTHERLPCTGLPARSVRRAYVDWRVKCTWHVGRVFPCRVYINSNRRDSQI